MSHEPDLAAFRTELRRFIREQLPPDIKATVRAGRQVSLAQFLRWHALLAAQGWLVPHWPREHGGQGWSVAQRLVFDEETCTADCPELNSITFDMIGPTLIRYGSRAQQARHLPPIAAGTQWWCQGYSEPDAGSDLASLRARARRQGGHYVVTGSKIWTSYAQYADWMFCLVRTDGEVKPQEGISFLLIDMRSPGIAVRPIVGIHGWSVFNEVFFDAVQVPVENLVGAENQGWSIAKSLLEFERLKLARIGENKRRAARAREIGWREIENGEPLMRRPWFRRRYADLQMRLIALEANSARFIERSRTGQPIGAEVSMLKLRGSQLIQAWEDLAVDALGPASLPYSGAALVGDSDLPTPDLAPTASSRRFLSRGFTIAGGSSEIQHNILAKQVLGL
jgi:alkylation response protein AidB-like acyl-CoA dehydrogenase